MLKVGGKDHFVFKLKFQLTAFIIVDLMMLAKLRLEKSMTVGLFIRIDMKQRCFSQLVDELDALEFTMSSIKLIYMIFLHPAESPSYPPYPSNFFLEFKRNKKDGLNER